MFPDFGGLELLLILVVSLLVLGPEKLPEAARSLAKFLAKWRLTSVSYTHLPLPTQA